MTSSSILSSPESRRLGRTLASMQREIDTLRAAQQSTQLGDSTLYGAIYIADPDGNVKGIVGEQADGSTGVVVTDGPAPPRPNTPSLTPLMSGVDVAWSGTFVAAKPLNFSHVNVHLSDAGPNFIEGPSNLVGTLSDAGSIPVAPLASGTQWWARLVAVNDSVPPKMSEPSLTVGPVTPDQVVAQDVLDGIVTEVKLANDAVTAAKIAAGAVGTGEIAGQAVTLSQLASGSVDATKLTSGAVTQPAIAANAVTANALAANSVIAGKLAADSVSTTNLIAGSVQATQIAAGAVLADKIAANAVTAEKINALAVTADKVAANTINAGHIQAGAVTAAKLAATLVLGSTVIAGTQTGARVQLGAFGIEAYRSNGTTKTLDFDNATGDLLIAGQYRSGDSGERVLIATDGSQTFLNSSGSIAGKLLNNGTTGLRVRGPGSSESVNTGTLFLAGDNGTLGYGPDSGSSTLPRVRVDGAGVQMFGGLVGIRSINTNNSVFLAFQSGGSDISGSVLHLKYVNGGAVWGAPSQNVGLVFADGRLYVTDGAGTSGSRRPIEASAFPVGSSQDVKEGVGEIVIPDARSSWDLVEGAPAQDFYYIQEGRRRDQPRNHDGSPVLIRRRDETTGEDEWVPMQWSEDHTPLRKKHRFPLAEDLAALDPDLVIGSGSTASVDLRDILGVLWDAVDMLIKRNRVLEERLTQRMPLLALPARPQRGDVREGIGAAKPGRTRRTLDPLTGQIRDRIKEGLSGRP